MHRLNLTRQLRHCRKYWLQYWIGSSSAYDTGQAITAIDDDLGLAGRLFPAQIAEIFRSTQSLTVTVVNFAIRSITGTLGCGKVRG